MRIYYSVSNGGDGSAYPTFYENEMLSDMAQSFEEEWGEPCTGFLEIEGDNIVVKNITTEKEYIKELEDRLTWYSDRDEHDDDGLTEVGDIRDDNKITLIKRYIRMLK